jgi:hypothetical protein
MYGMFQQNKKNSGHPKAENNKNLLTVFNMTPYGISVKGVPKKS